MPADESPTRAYEPSTGLRVALGVLALVVVLYSVVVATRPLLGVAIVVWLFGAYLLWRFFRLAARFVRAVERIADAMEARES
ncbi:hypothetical protein [Halorussus caseinilyticus]|uniref:Uncharacterized protein n=1 Tax=Halorussus caseinilyticus TaxID=3034025 RepID=A0ABD5WHB3_9EURY|nr:hypothetical protein [Halorussus sp. DT72]